MIDEPQPFDVCGPLPSGTVVLEASAGTGKTYTIAALAARYIAEGRVRLDQLMLVTFGRMATNELRLRVRDRLVSLEAALSHAIETGVADSHDRVETPAHRRAANGACRTAAADRPGPGRLRRGDHRHHPRVLSEMLDGLGVLGDREPQAHLRRAPLGSDPRGRDRPLPAPVRRPRAGRRWLPRGPAASPIGSTGRARPAGAARARTRRDRSRTRLSGSPSPGSSRRGRSAQARRPAVQLRRHADPAPGRPGRPRARRRRPPPGYSDRYRVVMVDEFQDTDPVQWEILRRAFHGPATLILIGDPKQAIYAFRGADVYSYLDAVGQADRVAPWRPTGAATRPWSMRWSP